MSGGIIYVRGGLVRWLGFGALKVIGSDVTNAELSIALNCLHMPSSGLLCSIEES
jgi:hypothetical protein